MKPKFLIFLPKNTLSFIQLTGPLVVNSDTLNSTIIFPSCQCLEGFEPIPGITLYSKFFIQFLPIAFSRVFEALLNWRGRIMKWDVHLFNPNLQKFYKLIRI
jgi:hypothetical protein